MDCPYFVKYCSICSRLLIAHTFNFHKKREGKYGFKSICKECVKKESKQYYKENKEKERERGKEYYQNNKNNVLKRCKEYRNKNKEKIKKYRNGNKEEKKEYDKQYYEDNKIKRKEQQKQWKENNPNKIFNKNNKRRLREQNQGDGITKEQWYEMMQYFDWECAYSGIRLHKENRTIDHIFSLKQGGEHEIWNLVPMYINYNSSKGIENMEDWYMRQEFFDIDKLLKIYSWIEYAYEKWGKN